MPTFLISAAEALRRFIPDKAARIRFNQVFDKEWVFRDGKVLLVDGDVVIDLEGLVYTTEMLPEHDGNEIGGIFITGDLRAPHATIAEPDSDWSPMLWVKGNVTARNLCLGGSASRIDGDVSISNVLTAHYNHGRMSIGGTTRVHSIIVSDYEIDFEGPVHSKYVASDVGRINIPVDFESDRLHLILSPDVISERNSIQQNMLIEYLARGRRVLLAERRIGKAPPVKLSLKGRQRIAELRKKLSSGEIVDRVDLNGCELREVPRELKEFPAATTIDISGNHVTKLPDWLGEFAQLEVLKADDCGLDAVPAEIATLPRLRELYLRENSILSLPKGAGGFSALEVIALGPGSFATTEPVEFAANIDFARFPQLRVAKVDYKDELSIDYRDKNYWDTRTLEVLEIGVLAELSHGIPVGLLEASNLRALSVTIKKAQLASALQHLPSLRQLELLSTGYGDLCRRDLAKLHDALPNTLIMSEFLDGDMGFAHSANARFDEIRASLDREQFEKAIALTDSLVRNFDLRRPLVPADIHRRVLQQCVRTRLLALKGEAEPGRKRIYADDAVAWADRVLDVLPKRVEACGLLSFGQLWWVRESCLCARAAGLAFGTSGDTNGALALLDMARLEAERFGMQADEPQSLRTLISGR